MAQSSFTPPASGDDGEVSGSAATYPPSLISAVTTGTTVTAKKSQLAGPSFDVRNALFRFDTSPLPDAALITSAILRLHVSNVVQTNSRNLVGEYYASANWPIDASDGAITPGNTAFQVTVASITNGVQNDLTLSSPDANISKTGFTGFRIGVDGGSPAGDNLVAFSPLDHPTNPDPLLIVNYITGDEGGTAVFAGAAYYIGEDDDF